MDTSKKFSDDDKLKLRRVILPEMMSSEEEREKEDGSRYFEVKAPKWRSKKYARLLKMTDQEYVKNQNERSKELAVERKQGTPSKRQRPKSLPFGYSIFVTNE